MNILHRMRHIAAAEPNLNLVALHEHRRIADRLRIPRLAARERRILRNTPPMDSIAGARKAHTPHLASIAPGVEHPIDILRLPDRRFPEPHFVESPGSPEFENRICA